VKGALFAVVLLLAACSNSSTRLHAPVSPTGSAGPGGPFLLATGFERPVCGTYEHPGPGCEFGIEGNVQTGSFDPRTGNSDLRIDMTSPDHMGVIALVPLPGGHAFEGVSYRVPAIPSGAIPVRPGYLELAQFSPTDGTLQGWPVELRLYPDRTLGLGLFEDPASARSSWKVPIDSWFSVVVEIENGSPATQRLWVFDGRGNPVAKVSLDAQTRRTWPHGTRTAQKIGGVTASTQPFLVQADDWYISTQNKGPIRIPPATTS
jgi:hypothetical protein